VGACYFALLEAQRCSIGAGAAPYHVFVQANVLLVRNTAWSRAGVNK
jgi:hypothetical protein